MNCIKPWNSVVRAPEVTTWEASRPAKRETANQLVARIRGGR
jgi:hypothetical protein